MRALIVAGGKSSRLYPLTISVPKSLLPVNGKPVISHILDCIEKAGGLEPVLCTTKNLRPQFENALGERVNYSVSPESYDTSGRILAARKLVGTDRYFLVYYGDILASPSLYLFDVLQEHIKNAAVCTLVTCNRKELELGVVRMKEQRWPNSCGIVTKFIERPRLSDISDVTVNIGIAVCSSQVFDFLKPTANFFRDTLPLLLKKHKKVISYETDFYLDIGSFTALEKAQSLFTRA